MGLSNDIVRNISYSLANDLTGRGGGGSAYPTNQYVGTFTAANSEYVIANNGLLTNFTTPFNHVFYVKSPAGQTTAEIYCQGSTTDNHTLYIVGSGNLDDEKLRIYWRDDDNVGKFDIETDAIVFDNQFHKIEIIYDGAGLIQIYVDNVLDTERSFTPSGTFTPDVATYGALRRTTPSLYLQGQIHNAVWTVDDVVTHEYRFDEGVGTRLNDYSGNDNDGTIVASDTEGGSGFWVNSIGTVPALIDYGSKDLTGSFIFDTSVGVFNTDGGVCKIGEQVGSWLSRDGTFELAPLPDSNIILENSSRRTARVVHKYEGGFYHAFSGGSSTLGPNAYQGAMSFVGALADDVEDTAGILIMSQKSSNPTSGTLGYGLGLRANQTGGGFSGNDSYAMQCTANGGARSNTTTHRLGRSGNWHNFVTSFVDEGGGASTKFFIPQEIDITDVGSVIAWTADRNQMVIGASQYDLGGTEAYENDNEMEIQHIGWWKGITAHSQAEEIAAALDVSCPPTRTVHANGDSRTYNLLYNGTWQENNPLGFHLERNSFNGWGTADIKTQIDTYIDDGISYDAGLFMIGVNDHDTLDNHEIITALDDMVTRSLSNNLYGHVYLMELPIDSENQYFEAHAAYWELLQSTFEGRAGVTVLDTWSQVEDPSIPNSLNPSLTGDGVHLNEAGYDVFMQYLLPLIDMNVAAYAYEDVIQPVVWLDGKSSETITLASGDVAVIESRTGNSDFTFSETTTAKYPVYDDVNFELEFDGGIMSLQNTKGSGFATFVSGTTLPDGGLGAVAGKGFTCTGLAYDAATDTFWVGNDGRGAPADTSNEPSVINLSKDGTTIISQIDMEALTGDDDSVQGVTVDTSDNTLWVVQGEDAGTISNVSKAGALISQFTFTNLDPNGIAYDSLEDELIVLKANGFLYRVSKAGTTLQSYGDLGSGSTWDQLQFDPVKNGVWITEGSNGSDGRVWFYSFANEVLSESRTVPNADAIEGIVILGDDMYIMNDAYFHSGSPALNRLLVYTVDTREVLASAYKFSELDATFVMTHGGTTSSTDCFYSNGDPLSSEQGWALYFPSSTTNQVRLIARDVEGNQDIITLDVDDLITPSIINVRADFIGGDIEVYQNGVLKDTATTTNVTSYVGARRMQLADSPDDRNAHVSFKSVIIRNRLASQTDRENMEAYLTARFPVTIADFNPIVNYDFSDEATVSETGGDITGISDKSGNGNDGLIYPAPVTAPTYELHSSGNMVAVWGDSENGAVLNCGEITAQDFFMILQYRDGTDTTFDDYIGFVTGDGTNGNPRILGNTGDATIFPTNVFDSTAEINGAADSSTVLPLPFSIVRLKAASPVTVNGFLGIYNNNIENPLVDRSWRGEVGQVIAFPTTRTDAQYNSILNILAEKWGITLS